MTNIDIGGGSHPTPGYINLDPIHGEGIWKRRIQNGIPAETSSVDAVCASHVLEHVPAGQERIDVFNEVWRVLKPGGTFQVVLPFIGTWHAIADPTHVSFWCPESFHYFDGRIAANASYGILPWRTLNEEIKMGWEGNWLGMPVKE